MTQTLPMSLSSSLLPRPSGLSLVIPGQYLPLLLIEGHKARCLTFDAVVSLLLHHTEAPNGRNR